LQVHPKADADAIKAAYERLRGMYDPSRLDGVAEELVAIARQRLERIESAYAVLSDPQQRATYDLPQTTPIPDVAQAEVPLPILATDDAPLDYRPLPPAGRTERPRSFNYEPRVVVLMPRGSAPATAIAVGAVLLLAVVGLSLLLTNWETLTAAPSTAQVVATPTASVLDQYEITIAQAKQAAQQNPTDAQAWITLGNQLYDSAQIVHENMPDSTLYQQRLPRWLEASQAYERALALQPDNASVLADKGTSLCYYGAGTGDANFVNLGTADTRKAALTRPDDSLIQLNLGICLISAQPPQADEAIATWKKVIQLAPADSPLAQRANELISQYQKKP
jgi:cytochrome c-type biogenesis protein CcmH/NrfG